MKKNLLILILIWMHIGLLSAQTWTADNGNGTYTNPLFFEEFSDPCMIRVGNDFYLTGTTMHTMPGLPIFHSRDLVNWRLISYAFDRLNLGPDFSMADGKDMYGKGIWAPSFVYNNKTKTFYIFANVNGHTTQAFEATNPYGPWKHWEMKSGFHDLSVFFDTDGKKYVCWGAGNNYLAQLNEELTDTIPGTKRLIAQSGAEGSHLYKINGEYIIIWAVPGNNTPQLAAKSNNIYGPYDKIVKICDHNNLGVHGGYGLKSSPWHGGQSFEYSSPNMDYGVTMHQGGIVDTPSGEWWGYSMQDHNSIGRVTCLSPLTWKDGYPYFGLPGNLGVTPRTWIKPNVGLPQQPIVPIAERDDDFSSNNLKPIWQWNHLPNDSMWSLTEAPGRLRLHSLPAKDFFYARNTLTQRAVGTESECEVTIETKGMQDGDIAGLALLNYPYAWIGITKVGDKYIIKMYDQSQPEQNNTVETTSSIIRLKVKTDFEKEKASFYYSENGDFTKDSHPLGNPFTMVFQLRTFQGVRYALFQYNDQDRNGGYADFSDYKVNDLTKSLCKPIPYNQTIRLQDVNNNHGVVMINGQKSFKVINCELGRVALLVNNKYVSVSADGQVTLKSCKTLGNNETFQWIQLERGDLVLLSLQTNRYLQLDNKGTLNALKDNPSPNRKDGTRFEWNTIK